MGGKEFIQGQWKQAILGIVIVVVCLGLWFLWDQFKIWFYKNLAIKLNLKYSERKGGLKLPGMVSLMIRSKSGRWFKHCLQGHLNGFDAAIFEFHFMKKRRDNRGGHRKYREPRFVVRLISPHLKLPQFTLCGETAYQKFKTALGAADIDFTDDPAFSRAFRLHGDDEVEVRKFFSPQIRKEFSRQKIPVIEGFANTLIFHRSLIIPLPIRPLSFIHQCLAIGRIFEHACTDEQG